VCLQMSANIINVSTVPSVCRTPRARSNATNAHVHWKGRDLRVMKVPAMVITSVVVKVNS